MSHADAARAIERTLEDPLAASRARADTIGFVGADVPIDVLLASRRPFGHLPWRAAGATPWADRWLESSFPYWARSVLEQWHEGVFDTLETVVFSRADDASQRLYYYVAELRRRGALRGPAPRIFDIALVPRDPSLGHTAAAILELGRALGLEPGALDEGIARANRLRRTLADIERGRASEGPFHERLSRAVLWSDPTQWIDGVVVAEQRPDIRRVLLAGSVPPDDRLHRAVEAAGASIVSEAHVHGLGRLGAVVPAGSAQPERVLARHLQLTSIGPRAMLDRARWIVARATTARAAGVILWLTREDEALAWHVPAQKRALDAAGIPLLVLPAARWQADDDTLDRIAEFCREGIDATA